MNIPATRQEVKALGLDEAYTSPYLNRAQRRMRPTNGSNNRKRTPGRLVMLVANYLDKTGVIVLNRKRYNRQMKEIA